MSDCIDNELQSLKNCAMGVLVGDRLGGGATRTVYALKHNPELVLKLEYADRQFCNVAEYDVWNAVRGSANERWFAPVVDIDVWAGALIMKRTQPITEKEFDVEVKRVPEFMGDVHWGNWGRLNGKIVCHDYGYHRLMNVLRMAPRMRKWTRQ